MSDIIIFPKLKGNLMQQIHAAMRDEDYETAYDLFNEYEKNFELSEDEQLIKLDCLYNLESFLELREESSILLNQGHYAYEKIVPYFIESLLKLKQFKTVIELIDGLRSEDVNHKLIVSLMPFYDEAYHQLNRRNDAHMKFIQTFKDNNIPDQLGLILELIRSEDYRFQMSFVQLLEHNALHPKVSSMMIEYLKLARFTGEVKLTKFDTNIRLMLTDVVSVTETAFMNEVMSRVVDYFEVNSPDVVRHIRETLQQHNLMLYPLEIEQYFGVKSEQVANAYIELFNAMFNLSETKDLNNTEHLHTIEAINRLEQFNL